MVTLLLFAAAAAAPSSQALKLGREVAEAGTLATLLPLMQQKETEELIGAHSELSAADQTQLRATSKRIYEATREKLMQAEAASYAQRLTVADLRSVVRFQRSPAGRRYRAAIPGVTVDTMQLIGKIDFKGDVLAAYCKETRKLCPR